MKNFDEKHYDVYHEGYVSGLQYVLDEIIYLMDLFTGHDKNELIKKIENRLMEIREKKNE